MTNFRKLPKLLLACTVAAVGLSACALPQASDGPLYLKNPIQVAESVERLELYSRPDGMSLSARDKDAVAKFLSGYARHGDGPLYMNVPNRQNPGISQTQNMVRSLMAQTGSGGAPLEQGQYRVAHNMPAPVVISYRRLKVLPRDCSITEGLHGTYNNQPYSNFGCSASANLGAMITDPRQFLAPYDMTPPDMRRRTIVYDKYIKGTNPASTQPARQETSSSDN